MKAEKCRTGNCGPWKMQDWNLKDQIAQGEK